MLPMVARRYSKNPLPAADAPESPNWADGLPPGFDNNSHYENHRKEIIAAFKRCKGNISATERLLRQQGFKCSRRWLGVFVKKWGLR